MTRALVIGECMLEQGTGEPESFAGDAFNVAAHLKRDLPSVEVAFVTVTGIDALSQRMRASWKRLGVDGSPSPAIADGQIGAYRVETDAAGERRFTYRRSNSAARRWFEQLSLQADGLTGAELVFLTGVSLAILPGDQRMAALDFVSGLAPRRLALDPNVRPALWENPETMRTVLDAAMARADILLPSLDDLVELWGDAPAEHCLERCQAIGVGETALTLGKDGCLVAVGDEGFQHISAPASLVIDTAGAGDAFDGAYLAARIEGRGPVEAARAGLARAGQIIALRGALPLEAFS